MQILTNIDLAKNELQNAVIQNLATYPANPKPGQIFYHSGDKTYYGYNGTSWIDLGQVLTGASIVTLINACTSKIDDDNLSANVNNAITNTHSHSNKAILDAIQESFTTILKNKLVALPNISSGIEASRASATGSGNIYISTDSGKIFEDIAVGVWNQIGGQDIPIATITTPGIVKIGANLTITEDGTLNANDNPASFIRKQERFVTDGTTTVFTLTKGNYKPNTGAITWFLNGDKQDDKALTETSSTSVTLPTGLPEDLEVMFEYYQVINWHPFPGHASEHLTDGVDSIPLATTTTDGLYSKEHKEKVDGIAAGAQVNQNAFSNVKVGATTVSADSATDILEFVAGTNVVLTPDATNDKVTIALSSAVETTTGSQTKATTAESNAKAYTDTKVAALVNSSPGTLDTLKELADALGDDPNFATTITNLINARARKYAVAIGDGTATTFNITHNFNTLDTTASLREVSTGGWVMADIQTVDANTIKVLFASAPTAGQYKLTVTG